MKNAIEKLLMDLPDEAIAELAGQAGAEIEKRRKKFQIEQIKVGMSREDIVQAHREIKRALDEWGGR